MQIDQHRGRALVLERMIDDDRRFGRERASQPAMRQEAGRRPKPQQPSELVGRARAVGQHAHAAMLRPRLGDELRGDLEAIGAMRVEIDRRHRRRRRSLSSRPVALMRFRLLRQEPGGEQRHGPARRALALPSFHATPAMSRCAQSNFFAKRDRKHAAVMLPPARPPTFAKSAKLLSSAFLVIVPQRQLPARDRRRRRRRRSSLRASVSLLLNMPQATCPSAITIAPVSVAMSTTASGS